MKIMNPRQDLILNWLKNIKWSCLTVWEKDYVDALWVEGKKFTQNQSIKLDEIYEKHRDKRRKAFIPIMKPEISEYAYIHDFDK